MQVSGKAARVFKAEARVKLQPIGGDRARGALLCRQAVQTLGNSAGFRGQYGWIGSHGCPGTRRRFGDSKLPLTWMHESPGATPLMLTAQARFLPHGRMVPGRVRFTN